MVFAPPPPASPSRRSRVGARAFALAAAALVAFAACRGAAPPATRPAPAPAPRPAPAGSAASASASASAPAASGDATADSGLPPPARDRAAGSTRGTIACGAARCRAKEEVCVWVERARDWGCVARAAAADGDAYGCDDASDCGAGESCCESFASAAIYVGCTPRGGPGRDCRAEICVEGDGAGCPAGQACSKGYCESTAPKPPTRCGTGRACRGAAPLCQWLGGKASCVSSQAAVEPADDNEASLYECTRPADCAKGEVCCSGTLRGLREAACSYACDQANQHVLCASDADCRRDFCAGHDDEAACRKGVACVAPNDGVSPPWLKSCRRR